MELRVHGEAKAITAPMGMIPVYEDLKKLFQQVLGKEYTREQYVQQFTIRVGENLAKIERIERIYRTDVTDTPAIVFETLAAQKQRLEALRKAKGDYVSPFDL